MLKSLSRAFAALTLLLAPVAHAQQTVDADPALWVVKDDDTTIYLFGTVHILKPGLTWFDESVKAAFDQSDQVMLEIVPPDPVAFQMVLLKSAYDPGAPALTSQLPEAKRAAYAKALTDIGAPASAFDHFKPWLPAMMISVGLLPKYGYDPDSGAEKLIAAAAKSANKPLGGLETPEQQIGYFDLLPRERQLVYLEQTIDQIPELAPSLDSMVKSWSKGDARAIGKAMNQDVAGMADMRKILLTDRNARWADWIAERMKRPGTVFIAVGAGHLAGKDSVQKFLARRHLKAKRVKY